MRNKESIPHGNCLQHFVKTKSWNYFHVFTDHRDQYIPYESLSDNPTYHDSYRKALGLAGEWIMAGAENIRVYMVEEEEDYRDGEILTNIENCILSIGSYPH